MSKYADEDVGIGNEGWKFVEKFSGKDDQPVYCNGEIELVCESASHSTYECFYDDGQRKMKTLTSLKSLAKNRLESCRVLIITQRVRRTRTIRAKKR